MSKDRLEEIRREHDCGCEVCSTVSAVCPATASSYAQEILRLRGEIKDAYKLYEVKAGEIIKRKEQAATIATIRKAWKKAKSLLLSSYSSSSCTDGAIKIMEKALATAQKDQ